jgi:autotransporter-associated beta strand protein
LSGGTILFSRDTDFSALPTVFNVRKSSGFTSDTSTANIYSTITHSLGPVFVYKTILSDVVTPTTLTVSKGSNVSGTGKVYLEPLYLDSGNNTILNVLSGAILEVNDVIRPITTGDVFNLTKDGPGELLLTLPDSSNQQTDNYFNGGTVTISRDAHLGDIKGTLYFYNASLLKLNSDSLTIAASRITNIASTGGGFAVVLTASYGGTIVGPGTFRKTLSGTLNLSGKNTPGSFNAEAGILNINSSGSLLANCNINAGATVNYNSSSYTRSHSFSGAGVFNQKSTGTLTLTGNSSSFNGTVNVDSGVLKTEHPNSIGSSALNLVGGNLNISYTSSSSEYGLATGTFKNSVGRKITFS